MSSCQFMSHEFFTWILFYSIFCMSLAQLKTRTHYGEDLCSSWPHKTLFLKKGYSGILTSIPSKLDSRECTITLKPEPGFSVVLSVYKFNLTAGDELIITDYHNFKVPLVGKVNIPDEQKSFISKGELIVRYSWDSLQLDGKRQKFQFSFTHVHDAPCRFDEFQCKNRKCISRHLVCNRHNHCGDNSDQENCDYPSYAEQDAGRTNEDFSGEHNINKKKESNLCRQFIMIGGDHAGKLGGPGPCYYKGSWNKGKNPENAPCGTDEFQCKNKHCIDKHYVCDRHNNCGDNSDEDYCYLSLDFPFGFGQLILAVVIAGLGVTVSLFDNKFGSDSDTFDVAAFLSAL